MTTQLNRDLIALIAKEDPQYAAELERDYKRAMIVLARNDPAMFCQYVLRNGQTGGAIYLTPEHVKLHSLIQPYSRTVIWTYPEFGKAVGVSENIPTSTGWKTMGDLAVGDHVFAIDGSPTEVIWASPIQENRNIYEVEFDDGVKITADAEHLWLAHNRVDRHRNRSARVVTTEELSKSVVYCGRKNWSVSLNGPVQYAPVELPVHPYVLGAWLGDGNSNGPQLTFHEDDIEIWERCIALEGGTCKSRPCKERPQVVRGTFGGVGFRKRLKSLGVVGKAGSKFIPTQYLTASEEQRRDLLAGILDTDGTVYTRSNNVSFIEVSFCLERLATDVLELVRSLGFKARMRAEPSKLYGRVVGTRYRIFFTARVPVFRLARKLAKQRFDKAAGSKANARYIVAVRPVPSVPVRCIRVAHSTGTFLVGRSYTVTHNCEVTGSKILLADGTWKNIEDLQERTELLTYGLQDHTLKPVHGLVTPNGIRPVLELQLENGHTLKLTEEHPLFCTREMGWKRAREFSVGDYVLTLRKLDLQSTTPESELPIEEAEILGYLLAGEVREKKVFVRRLWKSDRWSDRRAKVFKRAMWELSDCDRDWLQVSLSKKADPGDLSPYEYLNQLATVKDGYPVDVAPYVWKLGEESMKRLLTGFFVTAFCDPARKIWTRGRTVGVGDHSRTPKGFVHKCYETGDMIRRLALRVGVSVTVKHDYYFPKQWLVVVPAGQISIFYPGSALHTTPIPTMEAVRIVDIQRGYRETWALEIEEPDHSYISGGALSHNTTQMIGHALWKLGKDPNISIGIFQNAKESSIQTLGTIKQYIESSPELHDVFPELAPGDTWKENAITVRRTTFRRDPSVKAISLGSKFLGDRFDGLILDDIDNPDTVLTEESRKKTEDWVRRSALSRLTDGAWAVAIGNIWHEFDLMHQLVKSGWEPVRHPVMRPDGSPLDPERFTLDRIYHIRDVDQKPVEFERLYMLKERIEGEQRFKQEWIDEALRKGNQNFLQKEGIAKIPGGCRCITGVDLGVKKKMSSDPTVITTILEAPIGDGRYEYQILNIEKGRWNAEEIMQNITTQQKFFSSEVFVESNGAQDFLIQLMNLAGAHFRVNPFNTGRNKYDPMFGVESIAGELAAPNPKAGESGFGLWYFPSYSGTLESADPEMQELCNEMLAYTPGNHTGDILMSLWIAREGARNSRVKVQESKIQWGRLRLRK